MTIKELDEDINKKINENENYIRYTYFELRIVHNLSEEDVDEFLKLARNKLENKDYQVYFTGAKYRYQNEERQVETNEYLIAIKNN